MDRSEPSEEAWEKLRTEKRAKGGPRLCHRPYDDRLRCWARSSVSSPPCALLNKERHQIHLMFLLFLHRYTCPWSVLVCIQILLFLILFSQHILPIRPNLPSVHISQNCPFVSISAVLNVWMMASTISLFPMFPPRTSLLKILHCFILELVHLSLFALQNMSFTVLLYSLSPPCYQRPSLASVTTVQCHLSSPIHGTLGLSGNGGAVASLKHGTRMLWRGQTMRKIGLQVF